MRFGVWLVGAVGLLAFQVTGLGRRHARGEGPTGPDLTGMMENDATPALVRSTAVWQPPEEGFAAALSSNPFLRPAGANRRTSGESGRRLPRPHLSGIRMGAQPSVVINDRILEEGEAIAGWRVLSIAPDRVTLRSSHGKTIRLAASSLSRD